MDSFLTHLQLALEGKTNIALIVGRVDDIIRIRDDYGSMSCDCALGKIEEMLKTRFLDRIMRYGDEFRILLVGPEAAQAREIAESVRASVEGNRELVVPSLEMEPVESLPLNHRARITMHFGVTPVSSRWTTANGFNELLEAADEAIREGQRRLIVNRVY